MKMSDKQAGVKMWFATFWIYVFPDMLQNSDYMILSDADISFCMVCKLWHISVGCIFKNLALKLGIYNFRGVCACNCPPHLPLSSPKHFPSFPLLSYLFHRSSGVRSVCDCVCRLLFASVPMVVDHLLYLFLYSIHCLSFLRELYIYCF